MPPGPMGAKSLLLQRSRRELVIPKKPIEEILVAIIVDQKWAASVADARELAERWAKSVLKRLQQEQNELNRHKDSFSPFAFNSSSDYHIQGCAYIEPTDSPDVQEAKKSQARLNDYVALLATLTPRQFECLGKAVLELLGVEKPTVTPKSADEGIDFFGLLRLEALAGLPDRFPGVGRQLTIWLIGQAKHYQESIVSTAAIRELVGAIHLARGKAFGADGDRYADLRVRVCDPVFYLFFTTGRFTAEVLGDFLARAA